MQADLTVGLAPHQPDRQRTAQLAAGGLGADAAVQAGTQNVQFGLRHGALHTQQHPIIEQPGMVDAVGVGDQRVGHPGQIQQPIPVGVVAGQPRNLQRQHDSHLTEPDLRGQLGEPGPARGAGPGHAHVLVDHPHPGARPAQLDRAADQVVLAGGGFAVTGQLGHGGLAHIPTTPLPIAAAALAITLASNVIAMLAASAGRRSTVCAGGGARTGSVLEAGPGSGIKLSWAGCMGVLLAR